MPPQAAASSAQGSPTDVPAPATASSAQGTLPDVPASATASSAQGMLPDVPAPAFTRVASSHRTKNAKNSKFLGHFLSGPRVSLGNLINGPF